MSYSDLCAQKPSKHISGAEVSTFRDSGVLPPNEVTPTNCRAVPNNRHPDGLPDAEPNLKPLLRFIAVVLWVSDCSWKLLPSPGTGGVTH